MAVAAQRQVIAKQKGMFFFGNTAYVPRVSVKKLFWQNYNIWRRWIRIIHKFLRRKILRGRSFVSVIQSHPLNRDAWNYKKTYLVPLHCNRSKFQVEQGLTLSSTHYTQFWR